MKKVTKDREYTSDQIEDAKKLAQALASVSESKRPIFSLMLEAMLIGAELAGGQAPQC